MGGIVGVLGGMGPLATVDFLQKIIESTPAERDQDHVPVLAAQIPQIPSRVPAVLHGGESPLPALLTIIRRLERAGADVLVMPCNTAHFWYEPLAQSTHLEFLHIADSVLPDLGTATRPEKIGILGTDATIAANIYPNRLSRFIDCSFEYLSQQDQQRLVLVAIDLVKRGQIAAAGFLVEEAVHVLKLAGAGKVLLACTELPVALGAARPELLSSCIDPTRTLAQAAVEWSQNHRSRREAALPVAEPDSNRGSSAMAPPPREQ